MTASLDTWVAVDVRHPSQWVEVRATDYLSAREEARRQLRCSPEHVRHHVVAEGESTADARARLVRKVEDERRQAAARQGAAKESGEARRGKDGRS